MAELTEKQKRLADEYLVDLQVRGAAKRAGYSEGYASRVLRKPEVHAYVEQRIAERRRRVEVTQDAVLTELAKIGFASVSEFAKLMGGKKDEDFVRALKLLAEEEAAAGAVAQIKQGAHGVEIKLYDKLKALELLGRHLGLFVPGGAEAAEEDNFVDALQQATERVWTDADV